MIEFNTEVKLLYCDKKFDYYNIIFRLNNEEVNYYNNKLNNINLADFFDFFYKKERTIKKELKENNKRFKLLSIYYELDRGEFNTKSDRGYVYEITNKINGMKYIGRTITPLKRIREHIISQKNKLLRNDMIVYGLINFDVTYSIYDNYKKIETYKINEFKDKPKLVYNQLGILNNSGFCPNDIIIKK